jgi:hypothetical protein
LLEVGLGESGALSEVTNGYRHLEVVTKCEAE